MSVQRKFYPGSEWIYLKIYCGVKIANKILIYSLYPIFQALIEKKIASHWFFIRYHDPDFHLRVRIKINKNKHFEKVIRDINSKLKSYCETDLIWKVQIDTYERELERYENEKIDLAERFFSINSESVLDVLKLKKDDPLYWIYGLKFVDDSLQAIGLSSEQKLAFCHFMYKNYFEEFRSTKLTTIQIDQKYRLYRTDIEAILSNRIVDEQVSLIFNEIEKRLNDFLSAEKDFFLTGDSFGMIPSILHMHFNRFYPSNQRYKEFVLYGFLVKFYTTCAKMNKDRSCLNLEI